MIPSRPSHQEVAIRVALLAMCLTATPLGAQVVATDTAHHAGFCTSAFGHSRCRSHLIGELRFTRALVSTAAAPPTWAPEVRLPDFGPRLQASLGLAFNRSPSTSVGIAAIASAEKGVFSGVDVRYRRWMTEREAVEGSLGYGRATGHDDVKAQGIRVGAALVGMPLSLHLTGERMSGDRDIGHLSIGAGFEGRAAAKATAVIAVGFVALGLLLIGALSGG